MTPSKKVDLQRLLSLDDFLDAVSQALGIPEDELDTEHVLASAKRALDRAAAFHYQDGQIAPSHRTLASKAAEMVQCLLDDPPLKDYAGHVAFAALERLLGNNGARWEAQDAMTVLRFEQESRQTSTGPDRQAKAEAFAQFTRENIAFETTGTQVDTTGQQTLFSPIPAPLQIGVMLSNPFQTLTENERAELEEIRPAIMQGLKHAEYRLDGAMSFQLHHPSVTIPKSRTDRWAWVSQLLRDAIDVLIVCEVGSKAVDFDGASELDQHTLQDGPVLYLRSNICHVRGQYVDGREHELGFRLIRYENLSELSEDVSRWIQQHSQRIEAAARRRSDRMRLYRTLRRKLVDAWHNADLLERELAADAAGMTTAQVQLMLTSSLTVALAPAHRLDTICRLLGVSRDEKRPTAHSRNTSTSLINYGALLQAGAEKGWNSETLFALHNRAESRRTQHVVHRSRLRLTSPEDWIDFHASSGL